MSKTGEWIRANIGAILVPTISGVIALVISYGTSVREEADLVNRISNLERSLASFERTLGATASDVEDLEDNLSDELREVESMIISEGRELERTIIRLETRMDNFGRRLAFIDGIGAPNIGPSYYIETLPPMAPEDGTMELE